MGVGGEGGPGSRDLRHFGRKDRHKQNPGVGVPGVRDGLRMCSAFRERLNYETPVGRLVLLGDHARPAE